jgi:phage tail sheath protein FI
MPEYLSPEVYIEEVSSGQKPVVGVGTSTAGFVGSCQKGPIGEAIGITSFGEFVRKFGGYIDGAYLAFAVRSFFSEGGSSCYVVRASHYSGGKPEAATALRELSSAGAAPIPVLKFKASSPGAWGNDVAISCRQVDTAFELELRVGGSPVEVHANLSMDRKSKEYVVERINSVSDLVSVEDLVPANSQLPAIDRRPAPTSVPVALANGTNGAALEDIDYYGQSELKNGFYAFDTVEDISLLAVPEAVTRGVHVKGYAYCEQRKDCFYIADCQQTIINANDVVNYKQAQGNYSGQNSLNSKYGALYAPWVFVFDPRTGKRIKIPPSGVVAGRYADVDRSRGVHKAPSGISDGRLLSVLDVDRDFSDADQAKLNPIGVNLIRNFSGVGPTIWGARTTSSDPEWVYLNVRRFFLFVEQSVDASTKWTVFEPNDPSLWKSITKNVSGFLRQQWSIGALVGLKEEQAFYVKCDAETNPPESVDLGRVITEVGLAVAKPAEFVILRFTQMAGQN